MCLKVFLELALYKYKEVLFLGEGIMRSLIKKKIAGLQKISVRKNGRQSYMRRREQQVIQTGRDKVCCL